MLQTDGESNPHPHSEFTPLVSSGKLSHSTAELFNLACVLYCYYKNVNKECIEHLMVAFLEIYNCCFLDFISKEKVLRRLINCFSKAFSDQQSDGVRAEKSMIALQIVIFALAAHYF